MSLQITISKGRRVVSRGLSTTTLPSFLPAVTLSYQPISAELSLSGVLRGSPRARLWCPGGLPSLHVSEGVFPITLIYFRISGPQCLSPAGGACLSERKGPLQRDQALSDTFLPLSHKAPPPWHTETPRGVRMGYEFEPYIVCYLLHLFVTQARSLTLANFTTFFLDLVTFCQQLLFLCYLSAPVLTHLTSRVHQSSPWVLIPNEDRVSVLSMGFLSPFIKQSLWLGNCSTVPKHSVAVKETLTWCTVDPKYGGVDINSAQPWYCRHLSYKDVYVLTPVCLSTLLPFHPLANMNYMQVSNRSYTLLFIHPRPPKNFLSITVFWVHETECNRWRFWR